MHLSIRPRALLSVTCTHLAGGGRVVGCMTAAARAARNFTYMSSTAARAYRTLARAARQSTESRTRSSGSCTLLLLPFLPSDRSLWLSLRC